MNPILLDELDEEQPEDSPKKRCTATTKAGNPCRSPSVGDDNLCAFHSGRAGFGTEENTQKATQGLRKARQEKATARRRDALDWAADLVAERGETIAKAFIHAAERGDWRASEALMNRIYGKPDETVRTVEASPAAAVLKSMSLDEKLELLERIRDGSLRSPDVAGVLEP